jgi:hypothetical protein
MFLPLRSHAAREERDGPIQPHYNTLLDAASIAPLPATPGNATSWQLEANPIDWPSLRLARSGKVAQLCIIRPRGSTMPMLNVGETAPDFLVQDHDGKPTSLNLFRGKHVVLWFYPKADTPG